MTSKATPTAEAEARGERDARLAQPSSQKAYRSLNVRPVGTHHLEVEIARPEVHNALDATLVAELTAVLTNLPAGLRTVSLSGAGSSFCAGVDLRGWQGHGQPDGPAAAAPVSGEAMARLLEALSQAEPVVIAVVRGYAFAGGAGIVAACDLALCASDATFRFPEVRLGVVPAVIAPYVARAIGTAKARYLFLTGNHIDAPTALHMGLVHEVAAPSELAAREQALLRSLWQGGPQAQRACKDVLRALAGNEARERSLTIDTLERVLGGDEAKEGLRAFFARTAPTWAQPR